MKGYELIKEIHDGNVDDCKIKWESPKGNGIIEVRHRKIIWKEGTFSTLDLTSSFTNFKIIEEQQDIDIQEIEDVKSNITECYYQEDDIKYFKSIKETINKLVQAVKQLEKNKQDK